MPARNKALEEKYGNVLAPEETEEPEGNGDKPKPPPVKRPTRKPQEVTVENKSLDKLLLRLASEEFNDLKQLTDLPLKLIDPIAKGMAYYDSSFKHLEDQSLELFDWYIERCQKDIARCKTLIAAKMCDLAEVPEPERKRNWFDRMGDAVLGKPKKKITPELECLDLQARLEGLNKRLADLNKERQELVELDTELMFFKRWAHNLFLNRRSLGGHVLDSLVSLADAQIVTQQEQGIDKFAGIFNR